MFEGFLAHTAAVSMKSQTVWPRGYKTFLCSTRLGKKFIMLMNVKMSTTVGILTFISMINTTSECLKARKKHYFSAF